MFRTGGLRLPRHRATTAHLSSIYPFQAEEGLGTRGVYLGENLLTGGGAFVYDAFELYSQGVITGPNMLVLGEVGSGKSTSIKSLLYRTIGVFGSPGGFGRWAAIIDPKGEYGPLADALGLDVLRLHPGGTVRLNPLDAGPGAADITSDELASRRTALVGALVAAVLRRDLGPGEDAALGWAVDVLSVGERAVAATLNDVMALLTSPSESMVERSNKARSELVSDLEAVRFALGKLLDRELRGMFDGHSTVNVDWSGRGVVLDLSAIHQDSDALTLVMLAATAWLQALMSAPAEQAPRRIQVIDECWALLASEKVVRYLQGCWKLSRSYGVQNIAIAHRISDLRSQTDDGTAAAKVAMGLLADTQTRVLFRQSPDQVPEATSMLGLTSAEARLLPQLAKGRALWKVAGRPAVVQHILGSAERCICNTDQRLAMYEPSN